MRFFATFNLLYLLFLATSVFSSLHVDHAGSHERECAPNNITAQCHSDIPHEHESSHPGEDSLLEHTFEDGASLGKAYLPLCAAGYLVYDIVLTVNSITAPIVQHNDTRWYSALDTPPLSRAPPVALK
ncbi:MAG: hypothetical protein LDLANPLL_01351 [Turneriella sp.]|nr:hypothetical protein [Turneriella sp.]